MTGIDATSTSTSDLPPKPIDPTTTTTDDDKLELDDSDVKYMKIDPYSPYFLSSNDHAGLLISHVKFTGCNYDAWSRSLRMALKGKRKFGFVDGTIVKPTNSLLLVDWDVVQSNVVPWILNTIDESQKKTLPYFEEAQPLWELMKRRFTVSNGQRKHELKKELANCTQTANMTVAEYFGKLEKLWDELSGYMPVPACTCGKAEEFQMQRDDDKFHDFLGGLNGARFGSLRSQLLARDPQPTLDWAFKAMSNEERLQNREKSEKAEHAEVMAFAVQTGSKGISVSTPRFSRNLICNYCGRHGHDEASCYGKIGFPEWWGDRPKQRGAQPPGRGGAVRASGPGGAAAPRPRAAEARAAAVVPSGGSGGTGSSTPASPVTSEQLQQLLFMLNTNGMNSSDDRLTGEFTTTSWVIDTGASNHMTGDLSVLGDLRSMPECVVGLPDGSKAITTQFGTVRLSCDLLLKTVFYVPNLTCNLLSVSHLTDDLDCIVHCVKFGCVIQDRRSRMLIGLGERRGGMYYFRGAVRARACSAVVKNDFGLWHNRLGHPSVKIVQSLPFISSTGDFSASPCDVCFRAKQTRECFDLSDNKATAVFDLIHCDLWGPYNTPSTCGARYFLTIVDDFSRGVWLFLLNQKSEVSNMFVRFLALIKKQYNGVVRTVRSDNGTEFVSMKKFFDEHGIVFQTSCVGTPQQNGRVERKHRHILNVARSLMFQAHLPVKFWGECVLAAGYLINRTPSHGLGYKTPWELICGTAPSLSELRVFGCLCYVHDQRSRGDKFSSRSRKCVFLGYPFGKKGWKVYDMESCEFLVSRDVKFFEHIFPFMPSVVSTGEPDKEVEPFFLPEFEEDTEVTRVEPDPSDAAITGAITEEAERGDGEMTSGETSGGAVIEPGTETGGAEVIGPEVETLGRGLRHRVPSVRLKDYVLHTVVHSTASSPASSSSSPSSDHGKSYPIGEFVDSSRFSVAHRTFLAAVTSRDEPKSFKEAMKDPGWRTAMQAEIRALEENKTWTLSSLPPGKKALGSQWIYKIKYHADGRVERLKARLVVLGNHQVEGVDYTDTFAPVAKMVTVRLFLAVAAAKNWELHQMDVHNAFLHGDLTEEVYMKIPPGFDRGRDGLVCRLRKSLYGLKQAPRCWFAKLVAALKRYGFVQSFSDYSLFTYNKNGCRMSVLVYVDDLILSGDNSSALADFKKYLSSCFHMKDLGKLKYFLGVEVARSDEGIFLCQRKYALDIISESGLLGCKPAMFPMDQNQQLAASKSPLMTDGARYRRLVGRLIYLAFTRPDICFSVHVLSQFLQAPKEDHWEAALRVVRYLKGSPGQGVLLQRGCDLSLTGWCDSDWAGCPVSRRSVSGWMIFLGASPVSWKTKKQGVVSRSSAEAEYRAMAGLTCELKWLKGLLSDFGISHSKPMQVYCDSQSALHLAQNPVFHERTKHIEVDCHFLRDAILDGVICASHVSTQFQLADIFTKALGRQQFEFLLGKLGIYNLHAPT